MPIHISLILFKFLNFVLVISANMVVLSNHAVFSLLFLVLCFIFSSFLLFFLECEFLALIFVVVYVGGIAVLFLFAVMMLNSKKINLSRNSMKYLSPGLLMGLSLLVPMFYEASFHSYNENQKAGLCNNFSWYELIDIIFDIEIYGQVLYLYFVLQLLVAGLILLLVIIGIVYFTNIYDNKQIVHQSVFKQLSANSNFF